MFLQEAGPPPAQPTIRLTATEVALDAVVRDKKGRQVKNPKPTDWKSTRTESNSSAPGWNAATRRGRNSAARCRDRALCAPWWLRPGTGLSRRAWRAEARHDSVKRSAVAKSSSAIACTNSSPIGADSIHHETPYDITPNYLVSVICRTSFTRRSRVITCLRPEGQSTSTRSTFCASPRPKYRGSELCDR